MDEKVDEQYDRIKALEITENELLKRDFGDLGNLLKIIDSFEEVDKNEILIFIEINKLNKNCRLLFDETEKDLYKIWKNKRKNSNNKIENKIELEINNYIKNIVELVEIIPSLNKQTWNDTYIKSINKLLAEVKKFKIYILEISQGNKELIEKILLNSVDFGIEEKKLEKGYFISVVRDYILDEKPVDLKFESLSVQFFQYLVYANLEGIDKLDKEKFLDNFQLEITNGNVYFLIKKIK